MTVTARKHALLNRISPGAGKLLGLYSLELVIILSWMFLLNTVFQLISGSWIILLPLAYLLAVTMLAWIETQVRGIRGNSPLEALGLAEISLRGTRPTQWQTLRRLLLTPPLVLPLGIGLIPIFPGGRTLLQLASGTGIVPLDTTMDPRPDSEIFKSRRSALFKMISSAMISAAMAVLLILVPMELDTQSLNERISSVHSLPENERELLASYLEMQAMYPDCLEFHVRLASLYHRNGMEHDLQEELIAIRRMDPDHAILLLEEDLSVSMEDLIVTPDSADTAAVSETVIASAQDIAAPVELVPVSADSAEADSVETPDGSAADSAALSDSAETLLPVLPDSSSEIAVPDSTSSAPQDTVDATREADSVSETAEETVFTTEDGPDSSVPDQDSTAGQDTPPPAADPAQNEPEPEENSTEEGTNP